MIFPKLQLVLTSIGRAHVEVDLKIFLCGVDPIVVGLFFVDLQENVVASLPPMVFG